LKGKGSNKLKEAKKIQKDSVRGKYWCNAGGNKIFWERGGERFFGPKYKYVDLLELTSEYRKESAKGLSVSALDDNTQCPCGKHLKVTERDSVAKFSILFS
jgi:hypothetical protein